VKEELRSSTKNKKPSDMTELNLCRYDEAKPLGVVAGERGAAAAA
jgi:hypothetical protein